MSESKSHRSHFFDFSKFLEDCFSGDPVDWQSHFKMNMGWPFPLANIRENDKAYVLEMVAPGREKADFSIKFHNGELSVNAGNKKNDAKEGEKFKKREFHYGKISRTFRFSKYEIEKEAIKASYKKGILKVTLPKKVKADASQDNEIRVE
ncbi:MAG: Hsp20/alpha crystallin family protein [Bacteroidota bacterium]